MVSATPLSGYVVLIADDEAICANVLDELVQEAGGMSIIARDGAEAVKLYEENQYLIDLILMDVMMPKKDGLTAYQEIRQINEQAKVIFCSGYLPESRQLYLKDCFHADFIQKPLEHDRLLRAILSALKRTT